MVLVLVHLATLRAFYFNTMLQVTLLCPRSESRVPRGRGSVLGAALPNAAECHLRVMRSPKPTPPTHQIVPCPIFELK